MAANEPAVADHWTRGNLEEILLDALQQAGKDMNALTIEDLAPVDQLHSRGLEATRELADLAGFDEGSSIIDVGSGLGGPARYLAQRFKTQVTGIDLTEEFCQIANLFSEKTGLKEQAIFQHGSALELPFEDGSFDAAWTIQAQMNIADKERFYGEIHRVLKPGGRFVFQDMFAGTAGDPYFPVPWAGDSSISFLVPPEEVRTLLGSLGFEEQMWRDTSEAARLWQQQSAAKQAGKAPPVLGIHLILGPETATKRENTARSIAEKRAAQAQGVFTKPA